VTRRIHFRGSLVRLNMTALLWAFEMLLLLRHGLRRGVLLLLGLALGVLWGILALGVLALGHWWLLLLHWLVVVVF